MQGIAWGTCGGEIPSNTVLTLNKAILLGYTPSGFGRENVMGARSKGLWVVLTTLLVAGVALAEDAGEAARAWDFEADAVDAAPLGFVFGLTGTGAPGQWIVRAESDAPSGSHVLVQANAERTARRFPVAVLADLSASDVRASVRCKQLSGTIDQACGLVFRYRNENTYYVARANALDGTVRLYAFAKGRAKEIGGWSGTVAGGVWHHLGITVRGDHIEVYWDGVRVIDRHDATIADAGTVGVWMKADSVTAFDDLAVAPVTDSGQQ